MQKRKVCMLCDVMCQASSRCAFAGRGRTSREEVAGVPASCRCIAVLCWSAGPRLCLEREGQVWLSIRQKEIGPSLARWPGRSGTGALEPPPWMDPTAALLGDFTAAGASQRLLSLIRWAR